MRLLSGVPGAKARPLELAFFKINKGHTLSVAARCHLVSFTWCVVVLGHFEFVSFSKVYTLSFIWKTCLLSCWIRNVVSPSVGILLQSHSASPVTTQSSGDDKYQVNIPRGFLGEAEVRFLSFIPRWVCLPWACILLTNACCAL